MNRYKISFVLLTLFLSSQLPAQNGIRHISYTPDPSFAPKADWDRHLPPVPIKHTARDFYYDLTVAPDGRIFIIERNTKSILRFSAEGRYLGKFGGEGHKHHQFFNTPPTQLLILDDNTLVVNSGQYGWLPIFDLDGKFIRRVTVDYPIRRIRKLSGNRLLINGWIQLKGGSRDHIAILDLDTGKTTAVTNINEENSDRQIKLPNENGIMHINFPHKNYRSFILTSENDDIFIGCSSDNLLKKYKGTELVQTFKLPLTTVMSSEKEAENELKRFKKSLEYTIKKLNLPDTSIVVRLEASDLTQVMPYYYHLEQLPDRQLAAFTLHDGQDRRCRLIRLDADQAVSLGEAVFEIEGYDPPFLSGGLSLVEFRNGWLYALVTKSVKKRKHFSVIRAKLDNTI